MSKNTITRQGGTVRLTLPAKVANDLGALQQSLKRAAERMGHSACATGCDMLSITLEQELAFTERASLDADRASRYQAFEPLARGSITVSIPNKVSGDIEALTRAVSNVVSKLGCAPCCSGFDILFRGETNMMVLDERAEVVRFGGLR
jgi:hypothetical protein